MIKIQEKGEVEWVKDNLIVERVRLVDLKTFTNQISTWEIHLLETIKLQMKARMEKKMNSKRFNWFKPKTMRLHSDTCFI